MGYEAVAGDGLEGFGGLEAAGLGCGVVWGDFPSEGADVCDEVLAGAVEADSSVGLPLGVVIAAGWAADILEVSLDSYFLDGFWHCDVHGFFLMRHGPIPCDERKVAQVGGYVKRLLMGEEIAHHIVALLAQGVL
jgi:hypothetical protein